MLESLKTLCELNGVSGNEDEVRDYIISQIDGFCEYHVDNLGSVIAFKKGKSTPKNKVLISAHMDEVGMIVTYINSDGTLKISTVGGVDARVIFGRQVLVGKDRIVGVIGSKAVHNLTAEEKEQAVKADKLYVDIGAKDKEQAESLVSLGDVISFSSEFIEFGDGFVKSKAIDDRAGCAIMIDLIRSEMDFDTYFSFVTQEEIGLRGAKAAAFTVDPDIAIVLETTTAADIPSASAEKQVCRLGRGAVVSFMDRSTIYNKQLYSLAFETAAENEIPCQTKTMVAGGNDSGAIHLSRGGVKIMAISVPCRYLHSPSCVIKKSDFEAVYDLAKAVLPKVYSL